MLPRIQKDKKIILLVVSGVILLLLLIILLSLKGRQETVNKQNVSESSANSSDVDNQEGQLSISNQIDPREVIGREGDEDIYGADLQEELATYPFPLTSQVRQQLIEKIKADSRLLQEAINSGEISFNEIIYNSPDKDYQQRIALVKSISEKRKEATLKSGPFISGTVISIWFNNITPGAGGYDKAKEIAGNEINRLNTLVKNGQMTTSEAADAIRNNELLAQVDRSYKTNAEFSFNAARGDKITLDPEFDNILWSLNAGEVSDVYLIKDSTSPAGPKVDSVYMFAKIDLKHD